MDDRAQDVDVELLDLVAEGHAALAAPYVARVGLALAVLPKLVSALDRVALYQLELRQVRLDLTVAVRQLREEVWATHDAVAAVSFRSGKVHEKLQNVNAVMARLDRLLFTGEGNP